MLKTCEICGKEYEGTAVTRTCREKHIVPCSVCGIDVSLDTKDKRLGYVRGRKPVCSQTCKSKLGGVAYSNKYKGVSVNRTRQRTCIICGDQFEGGPKKLMCSKSHHAPCSICGEPALIDSLKKWRNVESGRSITCSPKCLSKLKTEKLQSDSVIRKRKKTFEDRFGGSPFSCSDVIKRGQNTLEKRTGKRNPGGARGPKSSGQRILSYAEANPDATIRDIAHALDMNYSTVQQGLRRWEKSVRPQTNSFLEGMVRKFLTEDNIEFIERGHKQLDGKNQIDFYLPEICLGIEVNDVWSHNSTKGMHDVPAKNRLYHRDKSNLAKEYGISIFHLWEWQVVDNGTFEIFKSMIRAKLGRFERRIGASKCKLIDISPQTAKSFIDANHIQGGIVGARSRALVYRDELVAVMSFRGNELIRFCNAINTQVYMGFKRLLTAFEKDYDEIITYSCNDYSSGDIYRTNKFEIFPKTNKSGNSDNGLVPPRYWWVKGSTVFLFSDCRKEKISARWPEYYDYSDKTDQRTEVELMTGLGYVQVFDSGKIRWRWINN